MPRGETNYARTGDADIAYHVAATGRSSSPKRSRIWSRAPVGGVTTGALAELKGVLGEWRLYAVSR